jgi:hypothetical protein
VVGDLGGGGGGGKEERRDSVFGQPLGFIPARPSRNQSTAEFELIERRVDVIGACYPSMQSDSGRRSVQNAAG